MKLRRTIYIGLGGTGIEVISQLKALFTKNGKEKVPSMIGFLAIDTNQNDLKKLREFEPNEKFHLHSDSNDAYSIYTYKPANYEWIPEENIPYLRSINHNGANQVRSNGRFLYETSEVNAANPGRLTAMINNIVSRITNLDNENKRYVDAKNSDIDICLVFSIAGGTGSGTFLPIAYLLKGINKRFNLVGYGFADSFFSNIGVKRNIKANAYAALLELDFCMQAERKEYKIIKFPSRENLLDRVPFNNFMYIDTNTYTMNADLHQVTRSKEEAVDTVVNALYLSATTVGADNQGVLNNLNGMMQGPTSNIEVRNGGTKKAWVSSVGTAEFKCEPSADKNKLAFDVADQELTLFKKGTNIDVAKWASKLYNDILHINEGGNPAEGDHDELIDSILNPSDLTALNPNAVIVHGSGQYNSSQLDTIKATRLTSMANNYASKIDSCKNQIRDYILDSLFPKVSGGITCGLENVKAALSVFEEKISSFKVQMLREQDECQQKIVNCQNNIVQLKNDLQHIGQFAFNGAAQRAQIQQDIALQVSEIAVEELQKKRRDYACMVYDSLISRSEEYYSAITAIINQVDKAITRINAKRVDNVQASSVKKDNDSISIYLDDYASQLYNDVETSQFKIVDWHEFYSQVLGNRSLTELSEVTTWDDLFTNRVKGLLPKSTVPIIMRALAARIEKEKLNKQDKSWDDSMSFINRLVDMARPLMDIDNYGALKDGRTEFVKFVAIPEFDKSDIEEVEKENMELRKLVENEFKKVMGESVQFIEHNNDENSIIVFQQLGVVSPYFLKGVATIGANMLSCESQFRNLHQGYSPFTDNEFVKAVNEKGHDLYQQIVNHYTNEDMERWIKAIILGIVERGGKDNAYRVESDKGELGDDYRFWKNFGANRHEAFLAFSSSSASFLREVDNRIAQELRDDDKAARFKSIMNAGKTIALEYSKCNLVDHSSNELDTPEVRKQEKDEIQVLRNMK